MKDLYKKLKSKEITEVYTHGATFHADDVFASALLKLINSDIIIHRVNSLPPYVDLAYDIGDGEYDHHQKESPIRSNGIPYASFGLLWKDLGKYICDNPDNLDRSLIQGIDGCDNLGQVSCPDSLSLVIAAFNPQWNSEDSYDDSFNDILDIAISILKRKIDTINSKTLGKSMTVNIIRKHPNEDVLVLPQYTTWKDVVTTNTDFTKNIKFCVYPSNRGLWNIESIPISKRCNDPRVPIPERYWGETLFRLPQGVTFVHKTGFLAACKTKEDAIRCAKDWIKEYK